MSQVFGTRVAHAAQAPAEMRGQIGEVAAIGGERVGPGAALGRKHVEKQRDQTGVAVSDLCFCLPRHSAVQRLINLSGGTVTLISRGLRSTKLASENTMR